MNSCFGLFWSSCFHICGDVQIPSVVETAAVLWLTAWVQVDEHDLGPLQGPVTALLERVSEDQRVVLYCCVHAHVHLCSEALQKPLRKK